MFSYLRANADGRRTHLGKGRFHGDDEAFVHDLAGLRVRIVGDMRQLVYGAPDAVSP